jgi:hypothetical protein
MKNDSRKVLLSQVSKNFDFWPFLQFVILKESKNFFLIIYLFFLGHKSKAKNEVSTIADRRKTTGWWWEDSHNFRSSTRSTRLLENWK